MNRKERIIRNIEFGKWFEEYFCDQQGEDSPYAYRDVQQAFREGWLRRLYQERSLKLDD